MSVLTFDEAIYSKAKEIHWKCGDQVEDIIFRMAGVHINLNFLGVIYMKGMGYNTYILKQAYTIDQVLYASSSKGKFIVEE